MIVVIPDRMIVAPQASNHLGVIVYSNSNVHNEGRALLLRASLSIAGLGVNSNLYW
jgi:hypothetical protein